MKSFVFYLSISLSTTCSFAQSNTVATGGEASGTGGTVSYTTGQIDYISSSGSNGSINQGVQQPYELFETNSIEGIGDLISVTIGPNPTSNELIIQIKQLPSENLSCRLYDANGKIVVGNTALKEETSIDLSFLSTGQYFLKILSNQLEIKTFKIIKN